MNAIERKKAGHTLAVLTDQFLFFNNNERATMLSSLCLLCFKKLLFFEGFNQSKKGLSA